MSEPVLSPPRRVLIVDDSRTIRSLLRATLDADPRLSVVGEASDPFEARERIKALSPDVITLDVEMPRMNGLDFLERLMRLRPMPVVMVSTRTKERSEMAVRALSIGAVDCVDVARVQADPVQRSKLTEAIFTASHARIGAGAASRSEAAVSTGPVQPYRWNGHIVLIGSSTGGVDAIERVLGGFPPDGPPAIIAQHMPEAFLRSFAQRLNEIISPEVRLAEVGDVPQQGRILIAPGGTRHLEFAIGAIPRLMLVEDVGKELYVPSVDRLFTSATGLAPRILSVLLTGMGRDGAAGMLELRSNGGRTVAQRGDTCVVDGMPRAAREAGAVMHDVPLDEIGETILRACRPARSAAHG